MLAEIESCRPPGFYDQARPLLDRYVDLMVAVMDLHQRLRRVKLGTPRSTELIIELYARSTEAGELFEALHLGPTGRGLPPPRLQ
jgi:hypothetical protein